MTDYLIGGRSTEEPKPSIWLQKIVVDKDCYSLAKIREIEKAGFTVESVK